MIHFTKGNIFDSHAEALVNTVNTVGVMGKGVALQFKEHFPDNFKLYKKASDNKEVTIGKMFVTSTNSMLNPRWIINFPTKKHWMHPSSHEYIETGLDDLVKIIKDLNIKSIAVPPLGAGQGGLDWERIKKIITVKLSGIDIDIQVFEPSYWPGQNSDQIGITLTKPRALILALMQKYRVLGFELSLLEIQKLAYFLQRVGQNDLALHFRKYYYGPYAHNLQHLLHRLENGFIITEKPVLDSKPLDIIYLNKEKVEETYQFIKNNCSQNEINRLKVVGDIIKGYESPFGLELLSSVDWIINENKTLQELKPNFVLQKIQEWSNRKANIFTENNISAAIVHLSKFREQLN
jgi:O-acetyl-ADP-ribose deacetylase (regulator of RNase III)